MARRLVAWCLPLALLVLCLPMVAHAEIPVCVRLPGQPKMDRWALSGSATVITKDWAVFTAKTSGLTVFVYAPDAPHENLRCVLPKRDEVHPPKCLDEHCTLVDRGGALPERVSRPGAPLSSVASCEQTKEGCKGKGKPKTRLEEIALELAIASAIANGEMNADLARKDGKQFGVIGGSNEDGVDNPIVQAAVATAAIASGVLLGQADKFVKKLEEACAKKAPLILQGTGSCRRRRPSSWPSSTGRTSRMRWSRMA
ncbi:hypothetical protein [Polyangium sp. y55x31]|uniref:hypothetical protein n=1 Tax=Polyangium sp. y55x31 TaxID=3042688 RepID=UPI0024824816|nr:hypothetical protein [Polyangium sp. y55x31]MDI1475917.1 hypothetical protein [Polyangium sp. y55x31]